MAIIPSTGTAGVCTQRTVTNRMRHWGATVAVACCALVAGMHPAAASTDDGRTITLSGSATSAPSIFTSVHGDMRGSVTYGGWPESVSIEGTGVTTFSPVSGNSEARVYLNYEFRGSFARAEVSQPPTNLPSDADWYLTRTPGVATLVVVRECTYSVVWGASNSPCGLNVRGVRMRFLKGKPNHILMAQASTAFYPSGPDGGQGDNVSVSIFDDSGMSKH